MATTNKADQVLFLVMRLQMELMALRRGMVLDFDGCHWKASRPGEDPIGKAVVLEQMVEILDRVPVLTHGQFCLFAESLESVALADEDQLATVRLWMILYGSGDGVPLGLFVEEGEYE